MECKTDISGIAVSYSISVLSTFEWHELNEKSVRLPLVLQVFPFLLPWMKSRQILTIKLSRPRRCVDLLSSSHLKLKLRCVCVCDFMALCIWRRLEVDVDVFRAQVSVTITILFTLYLILSSEGSGITMSEVKINDNEAY